MSAAPGWYPDPQQPGTGPGPRVLRFWDGRTWTGHTMPDPTATPSPVSPSVPTPSVPTPSAPTPSAPTPSAPTWSVPPAPSGPVAPIPPRPRRNTGRVLVAVLGVLSLLLLVAFGASRVGGAPDSPVAASPSARAGRSSPPPRASGQAAPTPGPSRSAGATTQAPAPSVGKVACLPADKASEQVAVSNDRVVSGGLSMPVQGAPWDEPFNALAGIPLVSAGALQSVKVADYKDGGWAAALMVGRMRDDVGASTPQAAAALMASCLEKTQYTVAAMSRRDTVNRAVTVDGRPGWTVEADLTLNDPDLTVSHELMVVTVVQTSPGVLGVFYASIPATTPDYTGLARATQKALRVVEVTGSV